MADSRRASVEHHVSDAYSVPVPGFSHAVSVMGPGRFVFVSGVTARAADGRIEGRGDLEAQTRRVFESVARILGQAGARMSDVVRVVTYLRDMDRYPEMQAVRHEIWPDRAPASTTVQVGRLFDPDQLIEVEVIAFVAGSRHDGD